jgi:hypothetical protein
MKSIDFNDVLRDNGVDVLRAMFDSVPSPSLVPADTPPAEPPPEDAQGIHSAARCSLQRCHRALTQM